MLNANPTIDRPGPRSTPAPWRGLAAGLALAGLVATGAAACTSDEPVPLGPVRLAFFDSCEEALADLRAATKEVVGPYGLLGAGVIPYNAPPEMAAEDRAATAGDGFAAGAPDPAPAPAGAPPEAGKAADDHSGTNVHEAGVDEPDLVKTDGRRIVTISNGRLSVVDVASRRLVGVVDLLDSDIGYDANLLLAGDHALVLSSQYAYPFVVEDGPMPRARGAEPIPDLPINPPIDEPFGQRAVAGASIILIDLTTPRVLSRARADGSIVDARQVGSTIRVVTRSAPRLDFRATQGSDAERLAANRAVIDASGIEAWAPRLEVTTGDETVRTQVGCESISRPTSYSGTNLLTVLTFDAGKDSLGDGSPITIAADGDTVYSNGTSLYVASNQLWSGHLFGLTAKVPAQPGTEIYRFDTTTTPPRFVGGGSVPGRLLNQYSMSEWDGRLRVATTTDAMDTGDGRITESQSGVYVLATQGGRLVQVGAVEGLGRGEQIYAVRFVGPVGYVVTFRQTDPLYTVDLRDPKAPVVRGELKIPGYSAYLHPMGETRLIGVGQDATDTGQILGTQVSLFDVGDLSAPTRIAKYTLSGSYSEAEVDPHAFLYWPADGLLVVPLQSRFGLGEPMIRLDTPEQRFAPVPASGALVLRIANDQIIEVGFVSHPTPSDYGYYPPIRRSLITTAGNGTTLWTLSEAGLMATDPATLSRLAWIPW